MNQSNFIVGSFVILFVVLRLIFAERPPDYTCLRAPLDADFGLEILVLMLTGRCLKVERVLIKLTLLSTKD